MQHSQPMENQTIPIMPANSRMNNRLTISPRFVQVMEAHIQAHHHKHACYTQADVRNRFHNTLTIGGVLSCLRMEDLGFMRPAVTYSNARVLTAWRTSLT